MQIRAQESLHRVAGRFRRAARAEAEARRARHAAGYPRRAGRGPTDPLRAVLGRLARGRPGGAADEPARRMQGTAPGGRRALAQGSLGARIRLRRRGVRSRVSVQVADGGDAHPRAGRGRGGIHRAHRARRRTHTRVEARDGALGGRVRRLRAEAGHGLGRRRSCCAAATGGPGAIDGGAGQCVPSGRGHPRRRERRRDRSHGLRAGRRGRGGG